MNDSNVDTIIYAIRDEILGQVEGGLDRTLTGLSKELSEQQVNDLSRDISQLEDAINHRFDKLVDLLEQEVESLIKWRLENDPEVYTRDDILAVELEEV